MRKLPAPPPAEPAKKPAPPAPPKDQRVVVDTAGFDKVVVAMTAATKANGEATAAIREVVKAIEKQGGSRAFEVEIVRDLSGVMSKLIVKPLGFSSKSEQ
jgi:hypothetical protein